MVAGIVEGLRWLGLDWDEGPDVGGPHAPYFQSERLKKYRDAGADLAARGLAYYCFCAAETLQQKRQEAEAAGGGWIYDRTCCALTAEEVAARLASGSRGAVRFKVPPGRTAFDDLVHGQIAFDNANIEDFVILRSDGQPTYHLSVVVDDIDMEITHVVRGDDHISNTPKQVLLYGALRGATPSFAHVPLILGPDKKRLSKRHGATSVMEYPRLGYLPEAMVNFLSLLGWSPGTDEELFSREELISRFTLEGISGGNAVFNQEKLDWFNQQHILRLPEEELVRRLEAVLKEQQLWNPEFEGGKREWFRALVNLYKTRLKKLPQFAEEARPLLTEAVTFDPEAVKKHLKPELRESLTELADAFERVRALRGNRSRRAASSHRGLAQIKAAALIHATRVAVTGRAASPGLFEVIELAGAGPSRRGSKNQSRAALEGGSHPWLAAHPVECGRRYGRL